MDIEGTVALVTGANRGIGEAIALALHEAGAARIYAASRGEPAPVCARDPERFVPIVLDVTDAAQVARAAASCGDVTLLVNNAGVNGYSGLIGAHRPEAARLEMDTNYFGTLAMCQAFAPVLGRNGGGAIANLLSATAQVNLPISGTLCASKAAAWSLTQGVRAELAAQGTHVVAVLPSAVDTDMARGFDGPKVPAAEVAAALLRGLEAGEEEVWVGDMALGIARGLATDPKAVERQLAAWLP